MDTGDVPKLPGSLRKLTPRFAGHQGLHWAVHHFPPQPETDSTPTPPLYATIYNSFDVVKMVFGMFDYKITEDQAYLLLLLSLKLLIAQGSPEESAFNSFVTRYINDGEREMTNRNARISPLSLTPPLADLYHQDRHVHLPEGFAETAMANFQTAQESENAAYVQLVELFRVSGYPNIGINQEE